MKRIVAIVTVLLAWASLTAQAQEEPAMGQLVLGGSVGALVGGVSGGLAAYGICRATTTGPWSDLACLAGAMLFGYVPGVPIGATVGVAIAGGRSQGNIWIAFLGASLAGGIAFLASDWALRSLGDAPRAQEIRDLFIPIVLFGVVPVSAGTGAAWGYSVGAQKTTD